MKRVLKDLQLTHIAAVDRPCQEGALAMIMKRDFSTKEREKLADKGEAMPGGGYPIANVSDLHNAIRAIGRAKNPEATRRHIVRRARALGATDALPDSWGTKKLDLSERITKQLLGYDDQFEDFSSAFNDVIDCMREADHPMAKEFAEQADSIAGIVADEGLSDMGKHEELYELVDATLGTDDGECLEKSMVTGHRLRALKSRSEALIDKAKKIKRGSTHTTIPLNRGEGDLYSKP